MTAAIEMIQELDKLNVKWKSEGRPELQIGIGLNHGEAFAPLFPVSGGDGTNYVTITGSMQGMPVMRVEYAAKGQTYGSVAVITNLPATIQIPMTNPNVPQLGTIRSIFVKKNADFGNYSPNYDVTLA